MKLTTIAIDDSDRTVAARVDGDDYVVIPGFADLGALLADPHWKEIAEGAEERLPQDRGRVTALIPAASKVICTGVNYRSHIDEMGDTPPAYPTLFAKFAESLHPPYEDIMVTAPDEMIDWEGELAIVIGRTGRNIQRAEATSFIAGYTVANDVSMRSFQFRTSEWLQGKAWEASTPLGPVIVTPDEFDPRARLRTWVGEDIVQSATVDDLLFSSEELVEYISRIVTLKPGDVILTGTPGGVGIARTPQRFLVDGDVVRVEIDGIGAVENCIRVHHVG